MVEKRSKRSLECGQCNDTKILCRFSANTATLSVLNQLRHNFATEALPHLLRCANNMLIFINAVKTRRSWESLSFREGFLQTQHRPRTAKGQIQPKKVLSKKGVMPATFKDTTPSFSSCCCVTHSIVSSSPSLRGSVVFPRAPQAH